VSPRDSHEAVSRATNTTSESAPTVSVPSVTPFSARPNGGATVTELTDESFRRTVSFRPEA
jgi:hypothetical protein